MSSSRFAAWMKSAWRDEKYAEVFGHACDNALKSFQNMDAQELGMLIKSRSHRSV